jgi:hypothetical protein
MTSIGTRMASQMTPEAMKSDQPSVSHSGPPKTLRHARAITRPATMISAVPVAVNRYP